MTVPVLFVGNFLTSSGWTVSVCEELAGRFADRGWPIVTTSDKPGRIRRLADMLTTVLRRRDDFAVAAVDVFSGPAFFWAEAVCAALRMVRKPYLLTLHGGNLPGFARRHRLRVHRLLHSADAVVTPSPYLFQAMSGERSDIHLLPNALDLARYTFRVRRQPSPRIIWVRAFHEIYNPLLAVKVLSLLAGEFPGIRLTMLGPERGAGTVASVRSLAAELGVSGLLDIPGPAPKEKVPGWLDQNDIFLNTTNIDNTPVSVLEGMASGLCVVSTNAGGIPYLLTHERDALLVPPDDPGAMTAAVRRVLTDNSVSSAISCNARKKAESLDWSVILPQWESVILRIASGVGGVS